MESRKDYWANRSINFLQPLLRLAEKRVRIATGFFTIQGYDLLRDPLAEKRVFLMVGYDEAGRERLRERLIDEIMFHLRAWGDENRRAAVLVLVEQLQRRAFFLVEQQPAPFLDGRVRDRDHAKVYIVDDDIAAVGSTNLTVNGLNQNIEGIAQVPEERVPYWAEQFETYWHDPKTVDLTQALLAALLAWLELHRPHDIYLKTILALIGTDETPPPRPDYKMPVQYQQVVIERLLRQLNDWRGAMLVASTGLGKTVMATHTAYRLAQARQIYNVIVFAPLQVLPNWEESMASGGIACRTFTRDLLDRPLNKRSHKVRQVVAALERADEKYIIFVDESHHFKNRLRAKDGRTRHSFNRLNEAVERGAMVVLLTATPLAKGVSDLNNQLELVPADGILSTAFHPG